MYMFQTYFYSYCPIIQIIACYCVWKSEISLVLSTIHKRVQFLLYRCWKIVVEYFSLKPHSIHQIFDLCFHLYLFLVIVKTLLKFSKAACFYTFFYYYFLSENIILHRIFFSTFSHNTKKKYWKIYTHGFNAFTNLVFVFVFVYWICV